MLVQRQKDLLSILIRDKQWLTFSKIAEELKCSTKTVQRDIVVIKELLPLNWNLQIYKGKGVILNKPADSSCAELNSILIRNEMTFKIIDAIFKGDISSLTTLSEKLYVSPASLYLHLKKVDHYLLQFEVELKRKPLKFYGNVTNIIFMYQEFYIHSYGDHEWPFNLNTEKEIYLYVIKIETKLGIKLDPMYKRRLMYLISILSEQKKQGLFLSLEQTLIDKITDTPFYLKIVDLNQTNSLYFFSKEEIILILISINCSKYVHQNLLTYKENVLHHFKEGDVIIYRNIKDFIFVLEHTFQCDLLNNSEFIFLIIQYLKHTLSKYHFLPRMNFPSEQTTKYIKTTHQNTFYKVRKVYKNWIRKYSIRTSLSDEEVATVTLYVEGARMSKHPLYIKVLLLIEDSEKWELYIKGVLSRQFGSIFHFVNTDIKDIYSYDYTRLDIDLIITTFTSVQTQIPIVRISTIPTLRELHDIKDYIYINSFMGN
ncbi:capsule biosynthesis protein [Bacillus cereus]|uniref:helix-turn-helix domain-containing protein n=1 Tax=Bacillus cereus TaxID=1396 RepID=UPI000BF83292|nr:helix-turn-helix domain-containing protein [Bacillus cereus]PEW59100.1 capsule biosynthesis protein [Bacillus cereus]